MDAHLVLKDGKWSYFKCCGRCSFDEECSATYVPFRLNVEKAIANMTDDERDKINVYLDKNNEPYFTFPEPNWKEELQKCISSPYYFYINYVKVNGQTPTTLLSEEEFNKVFDKLKK